jgi:hypothetical protein
VIADPKLTLAWLVLAHLLADFALQTNGIAMAKFATGRRAWAGLLSHVAVVGVCLVPVALAFGSPGLAVLVAVTASHAVVDRLKIVATQRVEAAAVAEASRMHEGPAPAASLGTAWTPVPAYLFALDQVVHLAVLGWAWAVWLASAAPTTGFATAVDGALGGWDRAIVHRVALTGVVLVALGIVNVRAGALFVATLVHPREVVTGRDEPAELDAGADAEAGGSSTDRPGERSAFTLRLGPLVARMEPTERLDPALRASPGLVPTTAGSASPARIGATIGVLERLLVVAFVLTRAEAAIGLVVAAKTLARFRQLDDRRFAEYYLLGTLASVSVALFSALLAAAALS